jgi:hypothetical protein
VVATLKWIVWRAAATAIAWSVPGFCLADQAGDRSFDRDVRPLFNTHCTACHGGVKTAGGLSFLARETTVAAGDSGSPAIVPGDPEASELIRRVTSTDAGERMPPPEHGRALVSEEVAALREWIRAGAGWQAHWSFEPPRDHPLPTQPDPAWPRTSLDSFVAARLAAEGLVASPPAGPAEWLRRVSLDLVGLPPTAADFAAFLEAGGGSADGAVVHRAQEQVVDRLLASPHFGERWASMWLDLARYADTFGFEKDPTRAIWPWRDWVIRAFNADMPFDQFTIRQLAGDLMPDATSDDLLATAFHRNTQTNTEGGTDDEEFRVAAVIDRVNTTWTVWQATTFGCVQCHSHPYDPYHHDEYYRFLALFDGTLDRDLHDEFPTLPVPAEAERRAEVMELLRRSHDLRTELTARGGAVDAAVTDWQPLAVPAAATTGGRLDVVGPGRLVAGGTLPIGVRYDLDVDLPPGTTAIRLTIDLDSGQTTAAPPERGAVASFVTLTLPPNAEGPTSAAEGNDGRPGEHSTFPVVKRGVQRQGGLVSSPGGHSGNPPAEVAAPVGGTEPADPLEAGEPEPKPVPIAAVIADIQDGPFDPRATLEPDAAGFGGYPVLDRPRWCVLVLDDPTILPAAGRVRLSITQSAASNEGTQACTLRQFRLAASRDPRWTALVHDPSWQQATAAASVNDGILRKTAGPRVPVLREQERLARRATHRYVRGNRLDCGPVVSPGIPQSVGPPAVTPTDRLGMADWLVSDSNPLTARVIVNRLWAEMFGLGIVETLEDFGSSGARPTHPELLDHLAVRLVRDHHWSIKRFLREVALSAPYGRTAATTSEQLARDPRNRLLARGPRNRLTAEMVRDQALAWSGKFATKLFGPPVFPPQPEGIWRSVYSGATWDTSEGENRFRRSIYTFVKRTAGYPALLTFDAPSRDTCSARRFPTNTPLQALATLNDPMMIELAQGLAERMAAVGPSPREQIVFGCRELTLEQPPDSMIEPLIALHARAADEAEAGLDPLTVVATTLLNLDSALMR